MLQDKGPTSSSHGICGWLAGLGIPFQLSYNPLWPMSRDRTRYYCGYRHLPANWRKSSSKKHIRDYVRDGSGFNKNGRKQIAMAKERTLKEGLEFFPLDIDYFDDSKILLIESKFGLAGSIVATRLLCTIYRQGYYMTWNDGEALALARRVGNGVTFEVINEIVNGLLKCDFFDQPMFEGFGILTSHGIQTRWKKIITDCNRKSRIKSDFNLLIEDQKSDFKPQKSEERTQSKVKEIKVEESKVQESITAEAYDIIPKILKYFSASTDPMGIIYSVTMDFVETTFHRGEFEKLKLAFDKYQEYKARSREQLHGIERWIGTKEKYYQDGYWTQTDWNDKNSKYEQQIAKRTSGSIVTQVGGTSYANNAGWG